MNTEQLFFWATISIIANSYVFIALLRRFPRLRFRAYVLNLAGLSLCAFTLALTTPDTRWLAAFLLNLVFQNCLLMGDRRPTRTAA